MISHTSLCHGARYHERASEHIISVRAEDGSAYSVTFDKTKTVVTSLPSFDLPGITLSFVHFPPRTMTVTASKIGDPDWWRAQGCSGYKRHPGMPEDGQWTARHDKIPGARRLVRILRHFANCEHRKSVLDPLGNLARAMSNC